MSLPTASSVSSPGGNGAETSLLYSPVSAYSVERGQGQASTASRTLSASEGLGLLLGRFSLGLVAFGLSLGLLVVAPFLGASAAALLLPLSFLLLSFDS